MKLSEREREVLQALADNGVYRLRSKQWEWSRPLDVGGHSRTHHSATLARLVDLGLAERRQRSPFSGPRGSWSYRVTEDGLKALG